MFQSRATLELVRDAGVELPVREYLCEPLSVDELHWKRLLAIAAEMLGYELTGKKTKFLTSPRRRVPHRAARARCTPPARRREDDGDTSVATINCHYFNLEDDVMQEIIDGWAVPDANVFEEDLEPVCAATAGRRRGARCAGRTVATSHA